MFPSIKNKRIRTNFLVFFVLVLAMACGVQSKEKTASKEPITQELVAEVEANKVDSQKETEPEEQNSSPVEADTTFQYGYSAIGFPSLLTDEESFDCVEEMFDELSPKLLRFPGGTVANFYHQNGPGYGYVTADFEQIEGSQIESFMKKQLAKQGKMKPGTKNFIYPFIDFVKGKDLSVLLVANIYTGTAEEMLEMIKTFQDAGIRIAGVELGNECYMTVYGNKMPTGNEYLNVAEPFRKALKKKHPSLKIGMVAAPTNWHKESGKKKQSKYEEWNESLSENGKMDAIITHIYTKISCKGSLDEEYECAEKKLYKFNSSSLPSIYEHYHGLFANQEIWITEWNIKKANDKYGNTFLQAGYITDFMNTSFEFSRKNNIRMLLTFHNLSGGVGGAGNSLISSPQSSESQECLVKKRAAFYAFDAVNACFSHLDSIEYVSANHIKYHGNGGLRSLLRNTSSSAIKLKHGASKGSLQLKSYQFDANYLGNGPMISEEGSMRNGKVVVDNEETSKKVSKKTSVSPYQMVVIGQ